MQIIFANHLKCWLSFELFSLPTNIDPPDSAIVAGAKNRLWVVSGANLNNVTRLPDGKPAARTDELGFFIVSMSADGGASWSNYSTIPLREVSPTTRPFPLACLRGYV